MSKRAPKSNGQHSFIAGPARQELEQLRTFRQQFHERRQRIRELREDMEEKVKAANAAKKNFEEALYRLYRDDFAPTLFDGVQEREPEANGHTRLTEEEAPAGGTIARLPEPPSGDDWEKTSLDEVKEAGVGLSAKHVIALGEMNLFMLGHLYAYAEEQNMAGRDWHYGLGVCHIDQSAANRIAFAVRKFFAKEAEESHTSAPRD